MHHNKRESLFLITLIFAIIFSFIFLNNIAYANYDEDLHVLSHVINGEAQGYSMKLKLGVGSVVLNRVNDQRFPNTILEVVFQPNQYACTWDGNYDRQVENSSMFAAWLLLTFGSVLPPDIIWQGNIPQGNYTYAHFERTYFCG